MFIDIVWPHLIKYLGEPSIVVIHLGCFCGLEVFRNSLSFHKSPLHALYASICKIMTNLMLNDGIAAGPHHQTVLVIHVLVEVWVHSHPTLLHQSPTYPKTYKFLYHLCFYGPLRVVYYLV